MDIIIWLSSIRRWRRVSDACAGVGCCDCGCSNGCGIWTGKPAPVWRSACRACEGVWLAAKGFEHADGCEGGADDKVRRLSLERDAVAGVCADGSGVVAD